MTRKLGFDMIIAQQTKNQNFEHVFSPDIQYWTINFQLIKKKAQISYFDG